MLSTPIDQLEKLGSFYLGGHYDPQSRQPTGEPLLYRAKNLTTHAVCLGMTGSGKTGLCITLLEEAAIDGIPAIAIDLKGDITNLLLTFPGLEAAEFEPWVDPEEAREAGLSAAQLAAKTAETWRRGLEAWGQDGSRVARLRDSVETAIYTPGSDAGIRLALLPSLRPPAAETMQDPEALQGRIHAVVSGLLALVGLDAGDVDSREATLVANLLNAAWHQGQTLSVSDVVRQIQSPPFEQLGVLDLETFFPRAARDKLAFKFNNMIASPAFSGWLEGQALDVPELLHAPSGKPRQSIISIAHLDPKQRMLFVTLLLDELVAWMRTQPGTHRLRALLYIDEVFGYLPPTERPPSKRPLLTLLKQARAYGLGVVLATQNPVDLDYKALSNAGTWFLGRLQTERDKQRVIEGLEGASANTGSGFDRASMEATLAGLDKRVFVLHQAGAPEPMLFHTRWALSYLRGPLTRGQISRLMAKRSLGADQPVPSTTVNASSPADSVEAAVGPPRTTDARPTLPEGLQERFAPVPESATEMAAKRVYRPVYWNVGQLHFVRAKLDLDAWKAVAVSYPLSEDTSDFDWDAIVPSDELPEWLPSAAGEGTYLPLPPLLSSPKRLKSLQQRLKTHLYRNAVMRLWHCPVVKLRSKPEESEGAFRARATQALRERRDDAVEKIEDRYTIKLQRCQDRIDKAEQRLEREQTQLSQAKSHTALSVGATVLGALLGRRVVSRTNVRGAATAARSAGRIGKERGDVDRARQTLESEQQKLADLEQSFNNDLAAARDKFDPTTLELKTVEVRPRKSDIALEEPVIVWTLSKG